MKIENDISVGFYIQDMLYYLAKEGNINYKNLGQILFDVNTRETGDLLPYIGKEDNNLKFLGFAVLKDDKLIDTISMHESQGILYMLVNHAVLTNLIPSSGKPNDLLSFRTLVRKKQIKVDYVNGKPFIYVNLLLDSQLQYQYNYSYQLNPERRKELEKLISEQAKSSIEEILKKSQQVYKSDILQFYKYFKANQPKLYKQVDWISEYPKAEVIIDVKTKIRSLNFLDPTAKPKY